jgi:hypothetical protein
MIFKARKYISLFTKENFNLSVLCLVALLIIILYKVTNTLPEAFNGGEFIFKLASDLSLAYLGSFIFYIVQIYIPHYNSRKNINKEIRKKIWTVESSMRIQIYTMAKKCLSNFDINNLRHDDLEKIINNFDFASKSQRTCKHMNEHKLYLDSLGNKYKTIYIKSEQNYKLNLDYMLEYIAIINQEIEELFRYFDEYIEDEKRKLLFQIKDSSYHVFLSLVKQEDLIHECNPFKLLHEDNIIEEYYKLYKNLIEK